MKKMPQMFLFSFLVFLISGCASTLPSKSEISTDYNLLGINTYSVSVDCSNARVTAISGDFIENYCQILDGQVKIALKKIFSDSRRVKTDADIKILTTLEEINGGSAAARFWVGYGAGRSITTVFIKIFKKNKIIAEKRLTETTTMPNIANSVWGNESAILQDAPLIAKKIGNFIKDPVAYEAASSF